MIPPPAADPGDAPEAAESTSPAASAVALAPPATTPRPDLAAEPVPLELETLIRRDLDRGRRLVLLAWAAAFASLVLGLVSMRQAVLLVSVDRHLVTTEEIQSTGQGFDLLRLPLLLVVALGLVLTARWWRAMVPVVAELQRRGVVEGPPPRSRWERLGLPWRTSGVPADRATWADVRVRDGRRLVRATALVAGIAAALGIVGAIGLGAATDADASRTWRFVVGIDGAIWLVGFVLIGAAIDAARWHEAAAARALGVFIPLVDAPGRTVVRLVPPLLMLGAGLLFVTIRPDPWFVPCPQSTLACDGLLVPADHDGGSTATIWVVYAVHHAVGPPKGTLAIAVGGPGGSGLGESLGLLDSLDPALVKAYDILFWDQRGVGASEGKDCPDAGFQYATTEAVPSSAESFVSACLTEAGVGAGDVARYSTHQAAEDLESIRDHLGLERFALYGESYGTELAQTYATLHPDRLSALILDGAVDLTRSANEFWADAARGFEHTLDDTFAACTSDPDCRADLPDPSGEYDRALAVFASSRSVAYADPDGTVRDHPVDASAIESAIGQLLYEPTGRSLILRAVAAAEHGDNVPLARLTGILGSGEGPGVSDFAYHAITCADYRVSPTADAHDLAAVEAYAKTNGIDRLRNAEVYTSQYPCLSWPYQPATSQRPAPLTTTPYPVFVLGATDDPITPIEGAQAIAGRLADGYLVTTSGGPHVTFGRGDACVDGPVVGFLLDGRRPVTRSTTCGGEVIDGYLGLTPSTRSGYDSALDAMESTETEIFADPEVTLWNGQDQVRVGCRNGGYFMLTDIATKDNLQFNDCKFVTDLPLTGSGAYDLRTGGIHWTVTFPDGNLTYEAIDTKTSVTGSWKGQPVDQSH